MNISENSRVWIYQGNRVLSADEESRIRAKLNEFTDQWQAHGQALAALGEIHHHQFIVLSVDEQIAGATGCSIDKSVSLMKEIEEEFNLELFDRFRVAYREAGEVRNCSRDEFERLLKEGQVNQETIVFNNLVARRYELLTSWEVPVKKSWHAQVFT